MKASLEIKDRRYRLKTYKKCFLGTEAVAWLQAEGVVGVRCGLDRRRCRSQCSDRLKPSLCQSEVDALRIGNLLMDAGVFEHVTKGHEFKVTRPAVAVTAFAPHAVPYCSFRMNHCFTASLITATPPRFDLGGLLCIPHNVQGCVLNVVDDVLQKPTGGNVGWVDFLQTFRDNAPETVQPTIHDHLGKDAENTAAETMEVRDGVE